MLIEVNQLRRFVEALFQAAGSEAGEAAIVADHLIDANLTGHDSHGVSLIPEYLAHLAAGRIRCNTPGRLVVSEGSILVYDGERGLGQVVAREATAIAIQRAREAGVAVLALRNSHHIGRIGAYGEQCAAAGLVSIHFVNATGHQPRVAPYGGRDARLPTNPFCVAVPATDRRPAILLDMATSRIAQGKVRVARNSGRTVPPGCVLDPQGEPTTDPSVMFASPPGALLPFGEHKGFGLGLICEILAGALAGGVTIQPGNPRNGAVLNHMLAFVLDPTRIGEAAQERREIDLLLDFVTASPPMDPAQPVMTPGDPERRTRAERQAGGIPLDEGTWARLCEAAQTIGVVPPG